MTDSALPGIGFYGKAIFKAGNIDRSSEGFATLEIKRSATLTEIRAFPAVNSQIIVQDSCMLFINACYWLLLTRYGSVADKRDELNVKV